MKWLNFLIVLILGQRIVFSEEPGNSATQEDGKTEFRALSDIEQKRDDLQKERFLKRQDVIEGLIKQIQSAWESGDEKVLKTEILILGDECLNYYNIADLSEKEVKKLKRKGYRINSLCESLHKKILKDSYLEYEKKWSRIKTETEFLLKQSKGL